MGGVALILTLPVTLNTNLTLILTLANMRVGTQNGRVWSDESRSAGVAVGRGTRASHERV